ncbi:MAG: helix-turn-helix transcriptional regulator [Tepidisphaeraceae bacterium]|jgi:DNA-binding XRE family transcriptional regulator
MIGTLNINGVDYVVIPRAEYEGRWPKLPPSDARGERPAKSAVLAMIARSLIRRRTEAGLDQKRLAALAGVRAETISRIESGRYRPRRETMHRIDQAIASAAGHAAGAGASR